MAKNGYVAVKPLLEDALRITQVMRDLGIDGAIDTDSLHVTLFYAPLGLGELKTQPHKLYVGYVKPMPRLMGEPDSEWRALALELFSPDLELRHAEIKEQTGGKHSYPEYTPHLSVKYRPTPEDEAKLAALGERCAGQPLLLSGEYSEDLTD